jgi:hypothetical protein
MELNMDELLLMSTEKGRLEMVEVFRWCLMAEEREMKRCLQLELAQDQTGIMHSSFHLLPKDTTTHQCHL